MSTPGELACIYACLALHDDGIAVTAEKISTLVKSANIQVESYWPGLFAKFVQNRNINDLVTNVGSGGSVAAPAAVAPAAAPAAPVAEEKKKEEIVEESDDDMQFDIFGDD